MLGYGLKLGMGKVRWGWLWCRSGSALCMADNLHMVL